MMKYVKTASLLSLLSVLILSFACAFSQEVSQRASRPEKILITAVGDIMPGTGYPTQKYLPPDNGNALLKNVKGLLKNSDITFGNLEGVLLDSGNTVKACSHPSRCFAFRIPESYVNLLTSAGFNLLSIANNHIGDFGPPGKNRTMEILKNAGIQFAGLPRCPYTVFEKSGIRYGFCAFAPNRGTVDIRDTEQAYRIVSHLASISDITIVSFHGGAEGSANRHVTGASEMYLGEDRGNVKEFAHGIVDAGADLVLGHGPHITRAVELYKERFIAYSLGNFCTYKRFNLLNHNGIAPLLKIATDKKGRFLWGKIIPIKQEHLKGPEVDPSGSAIKEIIELSEADFPESPLTIDRKGNIGVGTDKPRKSERDQP